MQQHSKSQNPFEETLINEVDAMKKQIQNNLQLKLNEIVNNCNMITSSAKQAEDDKDFEKMRELQRKVN